MCPRESAHGFTRVDAQSDPARLIRCLEILGTHPFYRAYKRRIRELLNASPDGGYLDIGGGIGEDARVLAAESRAGVTSLDASLIMTAEARRRGIARALVGNAAALPFANERFDGCWADRTFQHLQHPQAALLEAVRVTRRGGRIVTADPDYGTQQMPFPDAPLAAKVLGFRAAHGLRHGTLAGRMDRHFRDAGLTDVRHESRTLVVRDPTELDNVFGLRSWAGAARERDLMTAQEVQDWERIFDEVVAAGAFEWRVTFFLTAGSKPR